MCWNFLEAKDALMLLRGHLSSLRAPCGVGKQSSEPIQCIDYEKTVVRNIK